MASIQILEICPVENQIQELSYDMTDSIRGGGVEEFVESMLNCVGQFLEDAGDDSFDPLSSTGKFLNCVSFSFGLLEV